MPISPERFKKLEDLDSTKWREKFLDQWYESHSESFDRYYNRNSGNGRDMVTDLAFSNGLRFNAIYNAFRGNMSTTEHVAFLKHQDDLLAEKVRKVSRET